MGRRAAPTPDGKRYRADARFRAPAGCPQTAIWLRFVLVPALTDDPQDISQIAKFAAGLGNVERVEVLPFHQLGRFKWKELGLDYTLENTGPPSHELVQRVCAQFATEGLKVY